MSRAGQTRPALFSAGNDHTCRAPARDAKRGQVTLAALDPAAEHFEGFAPFETEEEPEPPTQWEREREKRRQEARRESLWWREVRATADHREADQAAEQAREHMAAEAPHLRAVYVDRRRRYTALRAKAERSIRRRYLEALEEFRAAGLEWTETELRREARKTANERRRWWQSRLKGFLRRPWDAPICGEEALVLRCGAQVGQDDSRTVYDPEADAHWQVPSPVLCGHREAWRKRCDQRSLCERCAGLRKARDHQAMVAACLRLWRQWLHRPYGWALRWRLVTLTVDAREGETLDERFRRLRAGVNRWRRNLRTYTRRYERPGKVPAGAFAKFRGAEVVSYEVSTGRALAGHPHCHMLVLSPFLDRDWARATADRVGLGFVDLRQVRASGVERCGQGSMRAVRRSGTALDHEAQVAAGVTEVLKYVTKPPAGGDPERVAELTASIDRAIYGRRLLERTGELRDVYRARVPLCPSCGEPGHRRVEWIVDVESYEGEVRGVAPAESRDRKRAPPGPAGPALPGMVEHLTRRAS